MTTHVEVLSADRRAEVHERVLTVLARTGLLVESDQARRSLGEAGASVDEGARRVRLPRALVEAALAAAPRTFTLGGRREGWELPLDGSGCSLVADGEALQVLDPDTNDRRPATEADWIRSTNLLDAIEEVGVYWRMVDFGGADPLPGAVVHAWAGAFTRFSRHVQDSAADPEEAGWLLEVLGTVFGGREEVRRRRPFSFLFCPLTPLTLEGLVHGRLACDGRLGPAGGGHADADDGPLGAGRAPRHDRAGHRRSAGHVVPSPGRRARHAVHLRAGTLGDGAADRAVLRRGGGARTPGCRHDGDGPVLRTARPGIVGRHGCAPARCAGRCRASHRLAPADARLA